MRRYFRRLNYKKMDRVILEYKVIKGETNEGITYQVNNHIKEDWQPVGEVKVTSVTDEHKYTEVSFYQQVVLFEQ